MTKIFVIMCIVNLFILCIMLIVDLIKLTLKTFRPQYLGLAYNIQNYNADTATADLVIGAVYQNGSQLNFKQITIAPFKLPFAPFELPLGYKEVVKDIPHLLQYYKKK